MDRIVRLLDGSAVLLLVLVAFLTVIGGLAPENQHGAFVVAGICGGYLFMRMALTVLTR